MAIQDKNGVYCKVDAERCTGRNVWIKMYASEAVRRNTGEYDKVIERTVPVGASWDVELAAAPKGDTLQDSLTRSAYACLKKDSQFKNWTDC